MDGQLRWDFSVSTSLHIVGRQKRKDDLNRSGSPLFRQGGVTVGLTTRLIAEREQGGVILIGRFVEAIRETLIRQDILNILLLR